MFKQLNSVKWNCWSCNPKKRRRTTQHDKPGSYDSQFGTRRNLGKYFDAAGTLVCAVRALARARPLNFDIGAINKVPRGTKGGLPSLKTHTHTLRERFGGKRALRVLPGWARIIPQLPNIHRLRCCACQTSRGLLLLLLLLRYMSNCERTSAGWKHFLSDLSSAAAFISAAVVDDKRHRRHEAKDDGAGEQQATAKFAQGFHFSIKIAPAPKRETHIHTLRSWGELNDFSRRVT